MERVRSVFHVAVGLPLLGAFAMLVAVNRLTTWKRPRSVLEPPSRSTSPDPHLEEILDEMEGQGDDLADKTVERLYECAGVPAVQAANTMMQQRLDKKWCELCDQDVQLEPEKFEDEGQKVCRIMETQQPGQRLGEAQKKEIKSILENYIQQSAQEPSWIDRDLIEKGEEAFENHGMIGFAALACGSLPAGYAAPRATKVLGFTQRTVSPTLAKRRLIETSLFIMAVKKKGGLTFPRGEGILAIQSVRLMHAGVRYLLRKKANDHELKECRDPMMHALLKFPYNEQEEGVPINQVIMCATILCFSYIALQCFGQMGIRLSEKQERGYLHCWNVAAHVMGVQGKLLLNPGRENMKDAEALFKAIWRRYGSRKSDGAKLQDGQKLALALLEFLEGPFKAEGKSNALVRVEQSVLPIPLTLEHVPRLLIRQFIGEYGTEVLGIRLSRLQRFLLWLVSPTLQQLPELRRRFPRLWAYTKLPLPDVAEQIFRGMLVDPEKNFPRDGRPDFAIPTDLALVWGIENMTSPDVR